MSTKWRPQQWQHWEQGTCDRGQPLEHLSTKWRLLSVSAAGIGSIGSKERATEDSSMQHESEQHTRSKRRAVQLLSIGQRRIVSGWGFHSFLMLCCPHNSPVDMHHAPFRTPQARGRRLPLNPRFAVPTHMHARPLIFPFVYFHSSLSPFLCDIFPSISPVKTHTFFFLKYLCHERCF